MRAVFDLHTSNLAFDAAISGAEYWVQSHVEAGGRAPNGIALHRDFDLGVLEEDGRGGDRVGNISTITYLTSSENSMPTLIFTDFEIATAAGGAWGVAKEAWAVYPRAGKHVCFDGALWHGVPPAVVYGGPMPARVGVPGARRVTLLVNVWLDRVPRKALAPRAGAAAFGAVDVPPLEFAAEGDAAVEHWAAQAGPSWQRAGDDDVEAGALALPLFAEVEVEDGAPPTRELGVKLWLPPALVRGPRVPARAASTLATAASRSRTPSSAAALAPPTRSGGRRRGRPRRRRAAPRRGERRRRFRARRQAAGARRERG